MSITSENAKSFAKGLGQLALNLNFPLLTTIYDFCVKPKAHDKTTNKFFKTTLVGAAVGAGMGIALCSPKGLMSVTGLKVDGLPIDKMSDLFPQLSGMDGFDGAAGISWNTFLCIVTIAAATIVCKAMFAEAGLQYLKKTDPNLAEALPTGMGIKYGIFGNSAKDVERFKNWLVKCFDAPTASKHKSASIIDPEVHDKDEDSSAYNKIVQANEDSIVTEHSIGAN